MPHTCVHDLRPALVQVFPDIALNGLLQLAGQEISVVNGGCVLRRLQLKTVTLTATIIKPGAGTSVNLQLSAQ
jgi:hypothetical protein